MNEPINRRTALKLIAAATVVGAAGGAGVGCSATGVESVFGVDAAFSPPQAASKSVAASAAREKRVCNMKSSRKRGGGTPQLDGPAELGDIPESTS